MNSVNIKSLIALSTLALTLSCAAQAPNAQPEAGAMPQRLQQMRQATTKNEEQLHGYQWVETTTLTTDGRTLPPRRMMCRYGADGTILKTPLGPSPMGQSGGGMLRRHIVQQKKEKIQNEVEEVYALVKAYVPLDKEKFRSAMSSGKMTFGTSDPGGATIILPDYEKPGDQFRLTINRETKLIDHVVVKTFFDKPKNSLDVDVQFATLQDGTSYRALTTVEAPSKKLSITISSDNFTRLMD